MKLIHLLIVGLLAATPVKSEVLLEQDHNLTPGHVLTYDIRKICSSGYTKTVRKVTESDKKRVFELYNIPKEQWHNYVIDHLISLQLGGSNDVDNLWPEPKREYLKTISTTETNEIDDDRDKDRLEGHLNTLVCSGKLDLDEAQKAIASDWVKAYQVYIK